MTFGKKELKKAGLKITMPRVKVLELFENSPTCHLSADEVYKKLLERDVEIGLATVYRVLTQFVEAGILSRRNFDSEHAVYELEHGEHHDHMLCIICNSIEEFVDEEIEKIQLKIAKEKQFEITEHSLVIYGVCRNCYHKIN